MGHRLSKIYTRTGDAGTTGLGDGSRVPKDDPRVEAFGTVDELNSVIGMLRAAPGLPGDVDARLARIQNHLFEVGSELCTPGHRAPLEEAHIAWLEQWLDEMNAQLPWLKEFILPGGTPEAALAHLARTVCRRAERRVAALHDAAPALPLRYLNRLSDLLFVLARHLNQRAGRPDVLWERGAGEPADPERDG